MHVTRAAAIAGHAPWRGAVCLLAVALVGGCGGGNDETAPPAAPDPAGVAASGAAAAPDPDLAGLEPPVAEALRAGRRGVLEAPGSAEAWGSFGAVCHAHGLLAEAAVCYREAMELAPTEFRWTYLLALARESAGAEAAELSRLLARAVELEPGYPPAQLRLGQALFREGRRDEAQRVFERAAELAPDLMAARDREQGAAGELPDPVLDREVVLRGKGTDLAFTRAGARLRLGDWSGAVEDLTAVERLHPDDAAVQYWLGIAHRGAGSLDAAAAHLERALALDPELSRAHFELARILERRGDAAGAAQHLRRVAELEPDAQPVQIALAEALARQGDVDGVIVAYSRAAELGPLDARGHLNLGTALMRSGDPATAIDHFEGSLRLRPGNATAHYNLGEAYDLLGRTALAIEQYEATLSIDPEHPARQRLAELKQRRP